MQTAILSCLAILAICVQSKGPDGKQSASEESTKNLASLQDQVIKQKIVTPPRLMIMLKQKHPKVYLQVLKIKEQVMMDSHSHKQVAKAAIASEHLYRIHSDGSRDSLRSRLYLLRPSSASNSLHASKYKVNGGTTQSELDWFDKLALTLRLDHFWPRLLFSLTAGFAIVSLAFLTVHLICSWLGLYNESGADELSKLLDPNVRGPGIVRVPNKDIDVASMSQI